MQQISRSQHKVGTSIETPQTSITQESKEVENGEGSRLAWKIVDPHFHLGDSGVSFFQKISALSNESQNIAL